MNNFRLLNRSAFNKVGILALVFLILVQQALVLANSENINILIDSNTIKKDNPEAVMLDGKVYVDINNDNLIDTIHYSYSRSTPPVACYDQQCINENNLADPEPILTFDIILNGSDSTIQIDYMCTTIGVMNSMHNGMKDIFCGPSSILQWDGENYTIK